MKKLGFLVLAVVMAIGTLGVGYAAWTDQITINGTVNTGDVDINAVYFSGTDVYKDLACDCMITHFWVKDAAGALMWENYSPHTPSNPLLIASAVAEPTAATDDSVDITFTGAFPTSELVADVIIHCDGSIPVIVTADIDTEEPILQWLWDNGFVTVHAAWVDVGEPGNWYFQYCGEITGPIQMHYCDYVKIWLGLDLPQADDPLLDGSGYTQESFMNLQDLSFTGQINAIQWNESPDLGNTSSNPCNPL
jgi:hypothetical protein